MKKTILILFFLSSVLFNACDGEETLSQKSKINDQEQFILNSKRSMSISDGECSSYINHGYARYAFDKDLKTMWISKGDGESLTLELLSTTTVNSAGIAFYKGNQRYAYFELQYSLDGENFTTFYEGTPSVLTQDIQIFSFPAITTKYIRYIGHGNSSNTYNSIFEMEFYSASNDNTDESEETIDVIDNETIDEIIDDETNDLTEIDNDQSENSSETIKIVDIAETTCSSYRNWCVAKYATDGNMGTFWTSYGDGEVLTLALSSTEKVNKVDIAFYKGNSRKANFEIQSSLDGINFTTIFDGNSSGLTDDFESFNLSATQAKYIRYVGHGNNANLYNSVKELKVFSGASSNDENEEIIGDENEEEIIVVPPYIPEPGEKPRIVVIADIMPKTPEGSKKKYEVDDRQSFIRLLVYSNEFEIAGLIAANSRYDAERGDTKAYYDAIDLYENIKPNLDKHAKGYPTANQLRSVVHKGQCEFIGMAGVGEGKDTEGSNFILSLIEDHNEKPIWFLGWGGLNTLTQALWTIDKKHKAGLLSDAEVARMISKVRIVDVVAQDNSCAEIDDMFPSIFYVRATHQYFGFSEWKDGFTIKGEEGSQNGNLDVVNYSWFSKNVRDKSKFGEFGASYPNRNYLFEGDTPSFLYLFQNGLSDPMKPHYGSWGGRFSRYKEYSKGSPLNGKYDGYGYVYTDEHESVKDSFGGVNDVYACLWRWREDYQNDFAARMLWTISNSFDKANHNPVVKIDNDDTKNIIHLKANRSETLYLDASATFDPDNDTLYYSWWNYFEPGTYNGTISIQNSLEQKASITVPSNAKSGDTIHIVLTVRDNGTPILTSYRRVVITVK